jgi:hypothetical protein
VPLITPLEVSRVMPDGSAPDAREKDLEFEPPEVEIDNEKKVPKVPVKFELGGVVINNCGDIVKVAALEVVLAVVPLRVFVTTTVN